MKFERGKANYGFSGRSRAGDATSFAIPELKWIFDCGALIEGWKPKVVFLTHTHSDHAHFLTHMRSEKQPPLVFLPVESESFVNAHLLAYQEMIDCMSREESQNGDSYPVSCILRPVTTGEEIEICQQGKKFVVRTLRMDHRVPCIGYSIFTIEECIKKEYEGIPSKEIGKMKKEGVRITDSRAEPFICFLGDTTGAVFQNHPEILEQHKTIVVECTFIDEADIERARTTTHMHWNHLQPYVEAHPRTMFLLTHFSLKYSSLKVREFFNMQQEKYPNIHPMLVDGEIEEIWSRRKKTSDKIDSPVSNSPPGCACRICLDET